jgi:hypothetical protein
MPERPEREQIPLDRIRTFHLIGGHALKEVKGTFGRGINLDAIHRGDFSSAINPDTLYPFHSLVHSMNVGNFSRFIAQRLGLSPHMVALTEAVGRAHDVIRKGTIGQDEGESAQWFAHYARHYGIDPDDIAIGSSAILGTIPKVDPETFMLVGQHVDEIDFSDMPRPEEAELVARIVATADLGELFLPTGPLMSHMLLFEIVKRKPNLEEIVKFQRTQVEMLYAYQHPLGEHTPNFLLRHKNDVIRHSEQQLAQLENGEITTWESVVTQACTFIVECNDAMPSMHTVMNRLEKR